MKHKVELVHNLMYKGCEPNRHCIQCNNYIPCHCYNKEQLENMEYKEKENIMTIHNFRENLTLKADEYNKNMRIDKEVIDEIKKVLEYNFEKRCYIIRLIKPKINLSSYIKKNDYSGDNIDLFTPDNADPLYYKQLFINMLSNELGFTQDYMQINDIETTYSHICTIKLKW